MSSLRRDPSEEFVPLVDDGSNKILVATGRTIWDNVPILAVISGLLMLVTTIFLIVASLTGWLVAWIPMTIVLAPCWLAAVRAGDRMLDGFGQGYRDLVRSIGHNAKTAIVIAIVPAISGFVSLWLLEHTAGESGETLLRAVFLLSLGVGASVAILCGPTFAAAARYGAGPRNAWLIGARIVATRPIQKLGLLGSLLIVLWLAVAAGPVVLLALGPFAVLTAALSRVPLDLEFAEITTTDR